MEFGLSDTNLEKIRKVLEMFPQVERAVIYGSRAKGNYKPSSDIDLILFGPLLDNALLNTIRCQLDDLLLPYAFDLSIYDKIRNPDFIDQIKRIGQDFYFKPL